MLNCAICLQVITNQWRSPSGELTHLMGRLAGRGKGRNVHPFVDVQVHTLAAINLFWRWWLQTSLKSDLLAVLRNRNGAFMWAVDRHVDKLWLLKYTWRRSTLFCSASEISSADTKSDSTFKLWKRRPKRPHFSPLFHVFYISLHVKYSVTYRGYIADAETKFTFNFQLLSYLEVRRRR